MARLKIRFKEKNGKTVSKFATKKLDQVIFQNDGSKALAVTIDGATDSNSPLCDVDDNPVPNFGVPKGNVQILWVCGDWSEFKYTAQITGTVKEDPIVIIERKSYVPSTNPIVVFDGFNPIGGGGSAALVGLAGILLGIFAGLLIARTFGRHG